MTTKIIKINNHTDTTITQGAYGKIERLSDCHSVTGNGN